MSSSDDSYTDSPVNLNCCTLKSQLLFCLFFRQERSGVKFHLLFAQFVFSVLETRDEETAKLFVKAEKDLYEKTVSAHVSEK